MDNNLTRAIEYVNLAIDSLKDEITYGQHQCYLEIGMLYCIIDGLKLVRDP